MRPDNRIPDISPGPLQVDAIRLDDNHPGDLSGVASVAAIAFDHRSVNRPRASSIEKMASKATAIRALFDTVNFFFMISITLRRSAVVFLPVAGLAESSFRVALDVSVLALHDRTRQRSNRLARSVRMGP
jgi:hypothetical protein